MGWSSGSRLFRVLINAAITEFPDEQARERFYKRVIAEFENEDWDTQDECKGEDPAYDRALKSLHPDWDI